MKKYGFTLAAAGTAFLYLAYLLARAVRIPITVDEAATCFNHVPRLVFAILTYSEDAVPNNHILNTIGVKISAGLFGMNHVSARIPSLLGGVLFVWATFGLAARISAGAWVQAFAVAALLGNPYVAEFFALSRGYGLATGLMLFAVYQAWRFLEQRRRGNLRRALAFGALSVLANFTLLNFFAPFAILLLLAVLVGKSTEAVARRKEIADILLGALILAALCYLPLQRISSTDQLRYWGTEGFWKETLVPLVASSLYFYADGAAAGLVRGIAWAVVLLSLAGWVWAAIRLFRSPRTVWNDPKIFACGLLLGTVLANLAQAFWLKTPFLNARGAIFYYPLFALQLSVLASWAWERYGKRTLLLMLPAALLLLWNAGRCANLRESNEWWFDQYTFQVLDFLKKRNQEEGSKEPFSFDSSGLLRNSYGFHIEYSGYAPWVRTAWDDRNAEFYVTHTRSEWESRQQEYDVVLDLNSGSGWYVLRRK